MRMKVENRQEEVNALIQQIFADQGESDFDSDSQTIQGHGFDTVDDCSDQELLGLARVARNGEKFKALFDRGELDEYPSHSEARMGLLCLLAFWCQKDPDRMDRLFRESALYAQNPDKWDDRRGEQTLGHFEILKAIKQTNSMYQPRESGERSGDSYVVIDADELADLPIPRERVKGVLPEAGIGAIYGPSGCGKTFLVFDLAAACAKGQDWFGHRVESSPVMVVALEGGSGLRNRARAYSMKHGTHGGVRCIVHQPFSLTDPECIQRLIQTVKGANAENGILIIDTLNAAASGIDENNSQDMGRVLNGLRMIQSAVGGLVLIVHHAGKNTSSGMRGHSSLFAAMDVVIEVSSAEAKRSWKLTKSRDHEGGISHPFELEPVEIGVDEDNDPISSCTVRTDCASVTFADLVELPRLRLSVNQKLIAEKLSEKLQQEDGIFMSNFIDETHFSMKCTDPSRSKERAKDAINALVHRGVFCLDGDMVSKGDAFDAWNNPR
ncbi:MAG: AAA family ATPase [Magnetococcales bacterium]|nr:AAA family ATPase [Magnetococcales bacterium]